MRPDYLLIIRDGDPTRITTWILIGSFLAAGHLGYLGRTTAVSLGRTVSRGQNDDDNYRGDKKNATAGENEPERKFGFRYFLFLLFLDGGTVVRVRLTCSVPAGRVVFVVSTALVHGHGNFSGRFRLRPGVARVCPTLSGER